MVTLSTVGDDLIDTAVKMVKKMLDEDSEAITIIYGEDTDKSTAEKVQEGILKLDDELEVEIHVRRSARFIHSSISVE